MCGLFVELNFTGVASNIGDALNKMQHRGPDSKSEEYFDNISLKDKTTVGLALGHARLIIEGSETIGNQPMVSCCGRYLLVYNGEIYNYHDFSNELGLDGSYYNDTDVLFKLLTKFGSTRISELNGMWAFVFIDLSLGEVIISRDRFGVKPLFLYQDTDRIILSSTLFSIAEHLKKKLSINRSYVKRYLRYGELNLGNKTIFERITEIEPASILRLNGSKLFQEKFYNISEKSIIKSDSAKQHTDLKKQLIDAVLIRASSQSKVCAALSGGLDSSIISSILQKHAGIAETFSIGFNDAKFSEVKFLEDMRDTHGIQLNVTFPNEERYIQGIDNALRAIETPFRSLSLVSLDVLYEQVAEAGLRVCLTGQGADEVFGGYSEHLALKQIFDRLKFWQMNKKSSDLKIINLCKNYIFLCLKYRRVLTSMRCLIIENIKNSPLREYLSYEDRMSMYHGVEVRSPFMDYRVIDKGIEIDSKNLVGSSQGKLVLRELFENQLPSSIVSRKDKMGFVSPQELWQRNGCLAKIMRHELSGNCYSSFLSRKQRRILRSYLDGEVVSDWSLIWRVYCLKKWEKIAENHCNPL